MNEDLLYKLALRLSTFPGASRVDQPKLLVEKLPEALPVHIPFPQGSHVLGSLIRDAQSLQILLDVPLTAPEVSDFYQHELTTNGWSSPEDADGMGPRGGFLHSGIHGMHNIRYSAYEHDSGWSLNVQIAGEEQGLTDVRLQINRNNRSMNSRRRRRHHDDMFSILPSLVPPEGASQQGGGSSGGDDRVSTTATLELQKAWDVTDLTRHYTEQLRQASWTPIAAEQTEHAAWSTWTFRDKEGEEWLAAFYLFQLAGENIRYQLTLLADWKEKLSQEKLSQKSSWFTTNH
jgi:hypothetical protein